MTLTPQAHRLIAEAVRALPDGRSRDRWRSFAESARDELPSDVAVIVLEALQGMARHLEERLGATALDEDQEADILNDLGYIRAIEAGLGKEDPKSPSAREKSKAGL